MIAQKGDRARRVAEAKALYKASLAESGNCGEAALRALSFAVGYEINEGLRRVGSIQAYGSYVGNRCAVIQAALLLCSLLYGRTAGNGNRIPVRELAAKLQADFQDRLGHCHCSALNPGFSEGGRCPEDLSGAALTVATELLFDAPSVVEEKMNALKTKFKVDPCLAEYADHFMTGADWAFVDAADADGRIDASIFKSPAVAQAFRRGVIDKIADANGAVTGYRLGNFHRRIDCFLRGERAAWQALPDAVKDAVAEYEQDIRRWVLPFRKQGRNMAVVNALPLERALEEIEKAEGTFFIQECDCRLYRENNGAHPLNTCLHFPASLRNTNADRGYARTITRAEAVAILKSADEAGLVHNFEGDAFCNCCGCCCWALRGIDAYREEGLDVFAEYVDAPYAAQVDDACVGCGLCVKRCPVQALSVREKKAEADAKRCIGCGVCRVVCKRAAIVMRRRDGREEGCREVQGAV
jgi:Pyruvate/2-oxoacid:ferredoxin oxidoreductase delta subunit